MVGHVLSQLGDILLEMVDLLGAGFILSLESSQLTFFPTEALLILVGKASNQFGDVLIFFFDVSFDFFNGLFKFQELSLFLLEELEKGRVGSLKRLILMSIDVFRSKLLDGPFKFGVPCLELVVFLD